MEHIALILNVLLFLANLGFVADHALKNKSMKTFPWFNLTVALFIVLVLSVWAN